MGRLALGAAEGPGGRSLRRVGCEANWCGGRDLTVPVRARCCERVRRCPRQALPCSCTRCGLAIFPDYAVRRKMVTLLSCSRVPGFGGNPSTNERGDGDQVPVGDYQRMGLQTSIAPEWPWPAELDALAAAPQHHTLLLENERVRVLDTRIGPGELVPVHTHRWPSVLYVLSWSAFIRRDAQGTVILDSRSAPGLAQPASVLWSEALPPHSLENVGSGEIRIISVEVKPVAA